MQLALFVALLLSLAACNAPTPAPLSPFDALYGDCATVVAGPVCLLDDDRRLRLAWPAGQTRTIEQRINGRWQPVTPTQAPHDPPGLHRIKVNTGADRIALIRPDGQRSELALATETLPDELQAATAALSASDVDLDEVAATLKQLADTPTFPRHGTALALLGRVYFRLGRLDDAIIAFERAVAANTKEGRALEALRNTNTLSYLLIGRNADHVAIARRYAHLSMPTPAPAEARYFENYFVGIAAHESGDSRAALRRMTRAGDVARSMAWDRRSLDSDQSLALHLMRIGRFEDAGQLLDAWSERPLPEALRPCERANFLSNRAWLALLRQQATGDALGADQLLARAQPGVDEHCHLGQRINLRINQAFAHLLNADFAGARDALTQVRSLTDTPDSRLQLWALDIEARVHLALGELDLAKARLEELDTLARVTRSPDARWRAADGHARLAQAQGDIDTAIARFRDADQQLSEDLIRLPLDAGRDGLLASRRQSRQAHFALLVGRDSIDDAYDLVLRSHSDVLTLLEATQTGDDAAAQTSLREYRARRAQLQEAMTTAWTLPQDERASLLARSNAIERDLAELVDRALSRPRAARPYRAPLVAGELELGFFELRGAWVVFARNEDGVRMGNARCVADDDALAECLLMPFANDVRQANKLRVLPSGALWSLDFHVVARQLRGEAQPLSVTYALALPPTSTVDRGGHTLVVADAREDLPAAREERLVVRDAVAGHLPGQVLVLSGREATSGALVSQLGNVDLFHFAGHARVAGPRGWRSELALGADTSLSVFDILALPAVPTRIVLSGCETAGTRGAVAATIGLAQAFVLRGGKTVVAAVREVDDATTLEMMRVFYRAWSEGNDMARALALAQHDVSLAHPEADWSAFRVVER